MTPRMFLQAVWANAIVIAVGVLLCAGLVWTASTMLPRNYVAEARLVVQAGLGLAGSTTDDVAAAPLIGQAYAVMATTRPVLLRVIDRAGLAYDPVELQQHVRVEASINTPLLTITMSDSDPAVAAAGANAMADALVESSADQSVAGAPATHLLQLVESAPVPTEASAPPVLLNTLLSAAAMLVGLLLLVATVVYLREGVGRDTQRDEPGSRAGGAGGLRPI